MFTDNKKGFSMVEMVFVVGISAMLLVVINNVFFQNVSNVKSGEKINEIEFKKFMIWKDIGISLMQAQTSSKLEVDGYHHSKKSKVIVKDGKTDKFKELVIEISGFEHGEVREIRYVIEDNSLIRIRDDVDYTVSSSFKDAYFSYKDGFVMLNGILFTQTEVSQKEYKVPVRLSFKLLKRDIDVVFKK